MKNIEIYLIGRVGKCYIMSIDGKSKALSKIMKSAKNRSGRVIVTLHNEDEILIKTVGLQVINGTYQLVSDNSIIPHIVGLSDDSLNLLDELRYRQFANIILVPGFDETLNKESAQFGYFSEDIE